MSHVHTKGSDIEVMLRKALWRQGLRYRKNCSFIFGHPDIAFPRLKIAIFCDGEFWHGKDFGEDGKSIKSHRGYWIPKIKKNIERDREVTSALELDGWIVIRFWGGEIISDTDRCVDMIKDAIKTRKSGED